MILMTIIRAITGTALVLGLSACGALVYAASGAYNLLAFEKRGEIEFEGDRYSFAYFNNTGSSSMGRSTEFVTCPPPATHGPNDEVVVHEYAGVGAQLLSLKRLTGRKIGCSEIENWQRDVFPIASKICEHINQTPRSVDKEKHVYLAQDGTVHLWEVSV